MRMIEKQYLIIFFYREESGREPVRGWLRSLTKKERVKIGENLQTLQLGWPLGMPLVKSLGKGLWELRLHLDNRIARIFFTVKKEYIILLHGFVKKTQKIPKAEIELAYQRLKKLRYLKEDA